MQQTISRPARSVDGGRWLRKSIAAVTRALRALGREPDLDLSGIRMTDSMERQLADREFRQWTRNHWL